MPFFAITEPDYRAANWCSNILSGLTKELSKKRLSLTLLNSLLDLNQYEILKEDAIFVIGTGNNWLSGITKVCEKLFFNRVIVLSDKSVQATGKNKYSMITSNSAQDTALLYRYLQSYNKQRIALYGVHPHSPTDQRHRKSFLSCGAPEEDIFYTDSSPSKCFDRFMRRRKEYDAVICTGDYAAIFLYKKLKKDPDFYITCSNSTMLLHTCYSNITHIWHDYKSFGKIALDLYNLLRSYSSLESIVMPISSRLSVGESTELLPLRTTGIESENIGLKPNTDTDSRKYILNTPYSLRNFKVSAEIYWGYCTGFIFRQKEAPDSGKPNQDIIVYFANNRVQLDGAVDFDTAVAIGTNTLFYTYAHTGIFEFKSNYKAVNGVPYTLLVQKEGDQLTIWVDGYSAILSIRILPGFQIDTISLTSRRFGGDSGGLKSLSVRSEGFKDTVSFDNIDPATLDKKGFSSTMMIKNKDGLFVVEKSETDQPVSRHWFSGNGKNTPYYSAKYINSLPDIPKDDEADSGPEALEIKRVELLFHSCSKVDFQILEYLLNNKTYAQIADELFMSSSGVKYKLKKMFDLCGVSSKNELIKLVKKYT